MTQIEKENRRKYLLPPNPVQIDEFVRKVCGVSYYRFEEFFGMPKGTIKVVKTGYMDMPVKFWHIFYDQIIPTYGTNSEAVYRERKPVFKSIAPIPKKQNTSFNHDRLSAFK